MFWSKKKIPTIGEEGENPAEQEIKEVDSGAAQKAQGNFGIELAKIQGKLDSMAEMRKATGERFSMIQEQIGELRGQLTDLNQQFSKVEVGATKAIDKVESVQPETFNTALRKNEGKIDALKANLESNETLMKDLMKEMKEMRHKMDLYKGTEQILNLHEEIKKELANIKKQEAVVSRHSSRVESIFLDVEKEFSDFKKFDDAVKSVTRGFNKLQVDFEKVRVKIDQKADKKEFVNLLNKFNDFEKHTGNIIKLLDERSKHVKEDISNFFANLKREFEKKYGVTVDLEAPLEKKKKGFLGLFGKKEDEESDDKSTDESSEDTSAESKDDAPEVAAKTEEKSQDTKNEGEKQESSENQVEQKTQEGPQEQPQVSQPPETQSQEGANQNANEGQGADNQQKQNQENAPSQ